MNELPKKQHANRAEYMKSYYASNRDRLKEYQKKYQSENRAILLERSKEHYRESRQEKLAYGAEYRAENRDILARKQREYARANRDKVSAYSTKRRKSDNLFRLKHGIGNLIGKAFNRHGYTKASRTHEILGCDYPFFKAYIEQRFAEGMGWHNRSEWHLDHIIPTASAATEKQLIRLNHYTNFRPLWAVDNIRKGDKMNEQLALLAA